jgi:hypothetical protein
MKHRISVVVICAALAGASPPARAQQVPLPSGFYSFGADQTIADIGKMEWAPLQLQGLPSGIEIAVLRGELAKGGGEILFEPLQSMSSRIIAIRATRCTSG